MAFEYWPTEDSLAAMLHAQYMLQRESYGMRIDTFTDEERVKFAKEMILAMQAEIIEALDETTWKPWDKRPALIQDDAFFNELVDVWHFLMNLFLVAKPKFDAAAIAATIHSRYEKKNKINRDRQLGGYYGDNKCPRCRRALDDVAVTCMRYPPMMGLDRNVIPERYYCGKDTVFVSSAGVEV